MTTLNTHWTKLNITWPEYDDIGELLFLIYISKHNLVNNNEVQKNANNIITIIKSIESSTLLEIDKTFNVHDKQEVKTLIEYCNSLLRYYKYQLLTKTQISFDILLLHSSSITLLLQLVRLADVFGGCESF